MSKEGCHPHVKVTRERVSIKEMVFTTEEGAWSIVHLAHKYTDGCIVDLIKNIVINSLNTDFKEELEVDSKQIQESLALRKKANEPSVQQAESIPSPADSVRDDPSNSSPITAPVQPEGLPSVSK